MSIRPSHLEKEFQTSPTMTALRPNTAAPPKICDVDIPLVSFFRRRRLGLVVVFLSEREEGVVYEREEEEDTNPICFKLIVSSVRVSLV